MKRDEYLLALQRLIATEKGYKNLAFTEMHDGTTPRPLRLVGVLHADEGPTLVPRWPWDWCEVGDLVDADGYREMATVQQSGGETIAESCARCWLAWKGVDLSHLEASR